MKEYNIDITSSQLLLTYFLILFSAILVFTALGHILYQKRSPRSMIAWILSIAFLPYIAVPLYFFVGTRKREPKYKKEYVQFQSKAKHKPHILKGVKGGILDILEKNGIPPATKNNTFELITSSTVAYARMLSEIENAKYSIDICTYVFHFDDTTKNFLKALEKKAQEGVKVRLLLDSVGSLGAYIVQRKFKTLREAGAEVAFFTSILKRPFVNYVNLRNHRKIYLFDQTILLSGGMNLSDECMGESDTIERWEDLLYELKGPAVDNFFAIFCNDWMYATDKNYDTNKLDIVHKVLDVEDTVVQVVPSGPDISTDALYETLLNAIYNAKERIWIVTPYFVPDENMVQALVIAQHKGVDVKLITPKDSDHFFVDMVRSSYMRELDEVGIDVVLYEGNMLHAKAILFDHESGMVGSVNFDNRSLFLNYEVVTFVHSKAFIQNVAIWMNSLISHSSRGMKAPSKPREALENVMKVFAPLL